MAHNNATETVSTFALAADMRQSHISQITALGKATRTIEDAREFADVVRSTMSSEYDWSAKDAAPRAVHIWATGSDDSGDWPKVSRNETGEEVRFRCESDMAAGKPVSEVPRRVRTDYGRGVDALAKYLRVKPAAKPVDWMALFATAAKNAEDNGHTLADMAARLLEVVGESGDVDAALATAMERVLTAGSALTLVV